MLVLDAAMTRKRVTAEGNVKKFMTTQLLVTVL